MSQCPQWEYDTSEFKNTAVTENDWVCDKAMVVADLYTLSVVGLILGTFIFSAVADFFGRKLSFYIGTATCIVFTLCMILSTPSPHNYHLFAFFKVFLLKNIAAAHCYLGRVRLRNVAAVPVSNEYSL